MRKIYKNHERHRDASGSVGESKSTYGQEGEGEGEEQLHEYLMIHSLILRKRTNWQGAARSHAKEEEATLGVEMSLEM